MRVRGLSLLRFLHERGAVVWTEGTPDVRLPEDPSLLQMVWQDAPTLRAVLRRALAFRWQLMTPSAQPFLLFLSRGRRRNPPGTCPCCGGKVAEHEFLRCGLCALGAEIALAAPGVAVGVEETKGAEG